MEQGHLAIILHTHLPFVRHPEQENVLEENWLKETLTESYMPLLMMIDALIKEGVDFRLTFSLSPTLISMLLDPLLTDRYLLFLDRSIELGQREVKRTKSEPAVHTLARTYRDNLVSIRDAYIHRYDKNLVQAFRGLQETGKVEILASAATHGYLPLLSVDTSAVRSQIAVGIEIYRNLFGQPPKGFWLPECGYAPGIDHVLAEYGIRYAVLETHGITRADHKPEYGVYGPVCCPSGVTMFGRDPESSRQVWSAEEGYPGDGDYREFYRDIGYDLPLDYLRPHIHPDGIRADTGFKYYRVTGSSCDKAIYSPERAIQKANIHAEDFWGARQKHSAFLNTIMDREPIFVAPYDTELFGHWWFEGPRWLDALIRKAYSKKQTIRLTTLSEYLEKFPHNQTSSPCASSWGFKGYHETWLNSKNDWIYPHLHKGTQTMEHLAAGHPEAVGLTARALNQASRELLLAQASDWAFMMHAGPMAEYGRKRTTDHVDRLNRIAYGIYSHSIDKQWLEKIESQDNIFPQIDYRIFCEHIYARADSTRLTRTNS